MRQSLSRFVRGPAIHFLVLGALLFAGARLLAVRSERDLAMARPEILFTSAQVHTLAAELRQASGRTPTREELKTRVAQAVDDELLYQEALALGLDRDDRRVRARLIETMRAVRKEPWLDDDALVQAALALGLHEDMEVRRILRDKARLLLRRDAAHARLRELYSVRIEWGAPTTAGVGSAP